MDTPTTRITITHLATTRPMTFGTISGLKLSTTILPTIPTHPLDIMTMNMGTSTTQHTETITIHQLEPTMTPTTIATREKNAATLTTALMKPAPKKSGVTSTTTHTGTTTRHGQTFTLMVCTGAAPTLNAATAISTLTTIVLLTCKCGRYMTALQEMSTIPST
jgi:hypothetical protein